MQSILETQKPWKIELSPKNTVAVSQDQADKIVKLLEILDEQEDVQKVHSNFTIN